MLFSQKVKKIALALYLFCQVFFLINVQFPVKPNFDEFHYVPSAKQFLELLPNQNWEHPPLGKMMMAVGIGLWGDRPIGWRFMSTVFGSLTMVGIYCLGIVIFESESIALWIALLTLVNHLVYVQSRIGMLDTFMIAFLIWALVGFCATWNPAINSAQLRKCLLWTGIMFGLSAACKWFAIVPWVSCILLVLLVRLMQKWQVTLGSANLEDWYRPQLWNGITWKKWFLYLGVIPIGIYFLTFFPFLFVPGAINTPWDFIQMQFRMWDGQLRVVSNHPYNSHWTDWPLLSRPIWYAFDREIDQRSVRGVLLLGNPLIMWSGLVALVICFIDFIKTRNRKLFFIVFFYFVFYACWAVIPRKIAFYYYYYPAGLILSFALAYVFNFRVLSKALDLRPMRWGFVIAAACLFVYFFPILAALKIPAEEFRKWMWFPRWI